MDPFATLGLPPRFAVDVDALEQRYRDLMRVTHPDKHVDGSPGDRVQSLLRAAEVNAAYRTLRDELARAEAVIHARGLSAAPDAAEDSAFLMQMMDMRESLGDARVAQDHAAIGRVAREARAAADEARLALGALLDGAPWTADHHGRARQLLGRLRYFKRLVDEAEAT